VTITDGNTGTQLSRTAGTTKPANATSSYLIVKFQTDSSVTATGFHASWGGGGGGTPATDTFSQSITTTTVYNRPVYNVVAGTQFKVVMTGTNDADLYVRFGATPTTSAYDCRPYTGTSNETCTLTVPAGQTTAYVQVRGYSTATAAISATVTYTKP
jgi:vibriolysin